MPLISVSSGSGGSKSPSAVSAAPEHSECLAKKIIRLVFPGTGVFLVPHLLGVAPFCYCNTVAGSKNSGLFFFKYFDYFFLWHKMKENLLQGSSTLCSYTT